jgi:hypothetical protein
MQALQSTESATRMNLLTLNDIGMAPKNSDSLKSAKVAGLKSELGQFFLTGRMRLRLGV